MADVPGKLAPARAFHERISDKKKPIKVVAGGKLLKEELSKNSNFKVWWLQAIQAGRGILIADDTVEKETEKIEELGGYCSDDPHVLALAKISGARLLYTNDRNLQLDFKDSKIISSPRGKIYTTATDQNKDLTSTHKNLLKRKDLCKAD